MAYEVIDIHDIILSTACVSLLYYFCVKQVDGQSSSFISSSLDFHFEFAVSFLISSVPTWTCLFQVIERSHPTY